MATAMAAPSAAPTVLRMTSSTSALRPRASWTTSMATDSAQAAAVTRPMAFGWAIGRVTAAACALSVAIEVVQLALGRSADVDDVILNTVGAALGAAIAVAIAIFYRRAADRRPAPSEDRQGSDCTPPALR